MTIATNNTEEDDICGDFDEGVDLQLAISFAGNQFQFSSDASGSDSVETVMIEPLDDGNFGTGAEIPFAGTANRLTPNLGWP
jgi:hypothetical protein